MSERQAARDRSVPTSSASKGIAAVPSLVRCAAFLLLIAGMYGRCAAQDVTQNDGPESPDLVQAPSAAEPAAPTDQAAGERRRQNLVSVLMMLLGGVLIVGVAMIAATMIWGGKLRRLARVPDPPPKRQDELWYLKAPPATEEDSEADSPKSSATDGEATS